MSPVRARSPALLASWSSASAGGEVLVVAVARQVAAPAPADLLELAHDDTAVDGHPGAVRRAAEIAATRRMRRCPGDGDVGILDRVQVDRAAVRMLRPARRPLDVAAVEGRRVVRLDRAEVTRAVRVDRDDPPDREAGRIE